MNAHKICFRVEINVLVEKAPMNTTRKLSGGRKNSKRLSTTVLGGFFTRALLILF